MLPPELVFRGKQGIFTLGTGLSVLLFMTGLWVGATLGCNMGLLCFMARVWPRLAVGGADVGTVLGDIFCLGNWPFVIFF